MDTISRLKNNDAMELGMDEIKNDIQNSRLRWFGHVMQMREERIPKKMLHTKMEGKGQDKDPKPDG